ncbi:protein of unknown function [Methylotuvimicrobium alcaliphilum 20Z]|uniref:Uncharacterized protein n=1 Tax=Methylotuvimicrobium alcaliphilum (strain DSM 19304 / NCIMB 14124 / VKM B-2133 / 20Z) TaxID=1091494 RepID=G4SXU3_META2|nr:protein of unknown function [Methylotuvimicrobium alcaliphilum 20Z]
MSVSGSWSFRGVFPKLELGKKRDVVAVFSLTRMAYEPHLARGYADLWALAEETC